MKIVECLWKEQFVEKLAQKHQVSVLKSKRCLAIHLDMISLPKVTPLAMMFIEHWDKQMPDGICQCFLFTNMAG